MASLDVMPYLYIVDVVITAPFAYNYYRSTNSTQVISFHTHTPSTPVHRYIGCMCTCICSGKFIKCIVPHVLFPKYMYISQLYGVCILTVHVCCSPGLLLLAPKTFHTLDQKLQKGVCTTRMSCSKTSCWQKVCVSLFDRGHITTIGAGISCTPCPSRLLSTYVWGGMSM
jgi:hypothetical protein